MSSTDKLLERMRRSKVGWTCDDLEKLYLGLGFEYREGSRHRLYIHCKYPELRATVKRSRSLPIGYIQTALNLADRLKELEKSEKK